MERSLSSSCTSSFVVTPNACGNACDSFNGRYRCTKHKFSSQIVGVPLLYRMVGVRDAHAPASGLECCA